MPDQHSSPQPDVRSLSPHQLDGLIGLLLADGYRVIGPTVADHAIVFDDIASVDDLPVGMTDEQGPGRYRLVPRNDRRLFGYVVGPHSWKRFLFRPHEPLVQIRSHNGQPAWSEPDQPGSSDQPALAFIGVRSCDLHAIHIQDRVFMAGPYVDRPYSAQRAGNFIVAVHCVESGQLCFCASTQTGPRVDRDYDLCIAETDSDLLIEVGSRRGRDIADRLGLTPAPQDSLTRVDEAVEQCGRTMAKTLHTEDLPARLFANLDHPNWTAVGDRCLSCGNCTLVCPTCFCFDVSDSSSLTGETSSRQRSWDSCFNPDHSTIHGSQFRSTVASRYRQWASHKLASWVSQFGTSGCVGCGRCIAWCPVGIDLVEEVNTIAARADQPVPLPEPSFHPPSQSDTDVMVPAPATVLSMNRETADVMTIELDPPAAQDGGYACRPGQFNMLSVPGIGDVAISVSAIAEKSIFHTIRAVGAVTSKLVSVRPGDVVGLRGPFGSSWPLDQARGRPVVIIAGGIGLAPLRSAIREMIERPEFYPSLRLMYGARSPDDIIFDDELRQWIHHSRMSTHVTVDRSGPDWSGNVGVVTQLIRRKHTPLDGLYLICGPEIMMSFALAELQQVGVPTEHIFVSMERNMKCAAGLCGRCQFGPYFVCKDGPVFRYDQIAFLFGKSGF